MLVVIFILIVAPGGCCSKVGGLVFELRRWRRCASCVFLVARIELRLQILCPRPVAGACKRHTPICADLRRM